MSNLSRRITAWLAKYVGTYYFIEVEEKASSFGMVGLRKYRLIIRAISTRSAISAAYKYCLQMKAKDGRDYELSFIKKI